VISDLFSADNLRFLAGGLSVTLLISALSIFFSILIGTGLGVMRAGSNKALSRIAGFYVETVRNIPNLLFIYAVRFLTPLPPIQAAVIAFTIFTSAAIAEILRGGMNAIGRGQWEAAKSQGFGYLGTLRHVILPQAFRVMIPPLMSQFVTVIKDTSFVWAISIEELTGRGMILMGKYSSFAQVLLLFGSIAATYFVLNFTLSTIARRYSARLHAATH